MFLLFVLYLLSALFTAKYFLVWLQRLRRFVVMTKKQSEEKVNDILFWDFYAILSV